MPVKVPDFASVIAAQPMNRGLPTAAIAGPIVGNALAGISNSIVENKRAKESMLSFAELMAQDDPQAAKMYAAMAETIPVFDPEAASGGYGPSARGVGHTGGGPRIGGMTGLVMADMFDALKTQRDRATIAENEAVRYKYASMMEGIQHANQLAEIQERNAGESTVQAEKAMYDALLGQMDFYKAKYGEDEQTERQRKELEQRRQSLEAAERDSTRRFAVGAANALIDATEQDRLLKEGGKQKTENLTEAQKERLAYDYARKSPKYAPRLKELDEARKGRAALGRPGEIVKPSSSELATLKAEEDRIIREALIDIEGGQSTEDPVSGFIRNSKRKGYDPTINPYAGTPSIFEVLGISPE